MDDEALKIYGYVLSSSYRTKTLKTLQYEDKIPTNIAEDAGIKINHISKVLKELKEKGLIKCINESNKKNRIYTITPLGKEILKQFE